ncbi:MAG: hypothetical protein VX416_07750, partial [Pseudomonadota bacterium]|nr:hypothetical protein [Pseudomonadota bacterium]
TTGKTPKAPVREHSRTGGTPRGREISVPMELAESLRLRASQVKRRKVHRQGPEGPAGGRNFM